MSKRRIVHHEQRLAKDEPSGDHPGERRLRASQAFTGILAAGLGLAIAGAVMISVGVLLLLLVAVGVVGLLGTVVFGLPLWTARRERPPLDGPERGETIDIEYRVREVEERHHEDDRS